MDELDRVDKDLEMLTNAALDEISRKANQKEVKATGRCLYCEEPLDTPGKRWCGAECRDRWEKENKRFSRIASSR